MRGQDASHPRFGVGLSICSDSGQKLNSLLKVCALPLLSAREFEIVGRENLSEVLSNDLFVLSIECVLRAAAALVHILVAAQVE